MAEGHVEPRTPLCKLVRGLPSPFACLAHSHTMVIRPLLLETRAPQRNEFTPERPA